VCTPITVTDWFHLSGSGDQKHYDLLVIGGGSGGLACSKEGISPST